MLKIGLTGGIASGKSTASQLFSELGITIIDADIIARALVQPGQACYNKIIDVFGNHILSSNGTLNRKQLRQIIFSSPSAKQQLEQILHPPIRQQLVAQSEQCSSPYCILSVPLLIEANMQDIVDRILLIDIEPSLQLERLRQRDKLTVADSQAIIDSQCDRTQRVALSDDIISNNNAIDSLQQSVNKLHQKYLILAQLSANSC